MRDLETKNSGPRYKFDFWVDIGTGYLAHLFIPISMNSYTLNLACYVRIGEVEINISWLTIRKNHTKYYKIIKIYIEIVTNTPCNKLCIFWVVLVDAIATSEAEKY